MSPGGDIVVVDAANRSGHLDALTEAFALRYRVFVRERGWTFLSRPDGLDNDRHDSGSAVHIVALHDRRVVGHVRIIPGGYLAVARADPARVYDATEGAPVDGLSRFCIESTISVPLRETIAVRLFTAALRQVLSRGVGALLFDTDPSIIFMLRVLGFSIQQVGDPTPIGQRSMQPVVLRLDASVLSALPARIALWSRGKTATGRPARAAFFAS